jgi:hypothetical protein
VPGRPRLRDLDVEDLELVAGRSHHHGRGRPHTTRVDIEHRGWERLGTLGADWREANRAGWSSLLPHYTAACKRTTV